MMKFNFQEFSKEMKFIALLAVILQLFISDRTTIHAVPYGVKRDLWADIPGDFVTNLTSSPQYINSSDVSISDILDTFDAPFDVGENFGQRLTTFFMAPQSGDYTFYMTCHYQCELWISSDSETHNKKKILQVTDSQNDLQQTVWEKYPAQISSNISLQRYNFYYMEAIMKENTGKDHMGIGAKLPSGEMVRPISRQYLFHKIPVDISSSFFHLSSPNARLMNSVLSTHRSTPIMKCAQYCQMKDTCQSYNHVTSSQWCELNYERAGGVNGKLQSENGANYYEKIEL